MTTNIQPIEDVRVKWLDPSTVIAFTLFLFLPAILPIVRRAGPPVLIATGLFAAIILWREGRLGKVCRAHLRNPATMLFIAFMAWATVSLGWSTLPSRGAGLIAGCLMLVASIVMISQFPLSKSAPGFLVFGLSIGGAAIALDLMSGEHLLQIVHKDKGQAWRYNMVVVSFCIFSLGLLSHLEGRKPYKVAAALILVFIGTFLGESETAKLVLILFPALFLLAIVTPQPFIKPAFYCLIAFIFFYTATGMPGLIYVKTIVPADFWVHASGDERLKIWSGVADFALHGLPFGWGVETIAAPRETAYFIAASREIQWGLSQWHSHNNFLQITTELGLPGMALSSAVLGVVVVKGFPRSRVRTAAFVTFVTAIMGVAAISHGFWQSWWWAAVLIGWYALVGGAEKHEDPSN